MVPSASAQDLENEANSITAEADGNAVVSSVVVSNAVVWSDDSTSLKVKRAPKPKVAETSTVTATPDSFAEDSAPARSTSSSRSTSRSSLTGGGGEDSDKDAKSSKKSAKDEDSSKKAKNADDAIDGDDLEARGAAVIEVAKRYIGVPYRYGGSTPKGFDCSGFTSYVFAKFGIDLPRSSGAQRYAGKVVSAKDAVPGDIVWSPGHVAIYIGNGKIIDAPRPGKSVVVRSMYQSNPVFIRVL